MDMSHASDAHQIALELLKQIIALAAGVFAISATFIDNFSSVGLASITVLIVSWLLLILSVLFGLEAISAIVKARVSPDHDWSKGKGKVSASTSKYLFVAGIAAFALFALIATLNGSSPSPS